MEPLVSVIILNYNGSDYIFDCIKSVLKTELCKFEIILIDNNSTDGSFEKCKQEFLQIKLIKNSKNLAMAARNIGIDNAQGNFILFLDADTIVQPRSIYELIKSWEAHGEGVYQGKLISQTDHSKIESAGNMTNVFGFGFARGRGKEDKKQYEKFERISFPVGGCTFASTELIRHIGYIDESKLFFLMLDDVDYGWRAWLENIPCYYEPKSVIFHLGSPVLQWSKRKFFFAERNRWICLLSLYSSKTLFKIFPILLLVDIGVFFFFIPRGLASSKITAMFSLWKMIPKILARRKRLQRKREISDKEIIQNFSEYVELPSMMRNQSSLGGNIIINLSRFAKKMI